MEYGGDPPWKVWLGGKRKTCSGPKPRLCLHLCIGALLRQGLGKQEKARSTGTGLESAAEERRTHPSWTIHGSVGHSSVRADFKLLVQLYLVDPGHGQCIANSRLLLEIKERFVSKFKPQEGI